MVEEVKGKSRWLIRKDCILPLLLGIGAYLGLEVLIVFLNYPSQTYNYIIFAIFPAIAIPMVAGAKYGPIVGFLVGFGGKILADALLYGGIWILWPIGIGLMGFIPGLNYHKYYSGKYTKGSNLFRLSLFALLAAFIGTLIPVMLSIFVDQLGLLFPIIFYFLPLFFIAAFNGAIIAPIIARGVEYIDSKYSSIESSKISTPSPSSSNISQLGAFFSGFCFLLAFGLWLLNSYSSSGGHLGCGVGVPFGNELLGNLQIALDFGMYVLIGLGTTISILLLIRWLITRKKA